MYERFTDRARNVMQLASLAAWRINHGHIDTEHILLGLVKEGTGVAACVLENLDVSPRTIFVEVEKLVRAGPDRAITGQLPQTSRAKKVIEYAIEEARNFNHNDVDSVHLLVGLLREPDGVAGRVLRNLGLKLEDVREEMLALLGPDATTPKSGRRAAPEDVFSPPPGASVPSCPAPARLLRLLNATLPENEQAPLMEHLEGCADCREALETLAAGRDSWAGVARNLRGETGPERTRPFPPAGGASLDFLDPPEKPGQLGKLAHYEILEVIGRGGMGVVLKGFDQTLHRVVAIKVMAPELASSGTARERFEREARAAAAVSHDHVVTIHAVAEAKGLPYLVMQYVHGESLQQNLDRTGPLELKEVLRIGMQAADGLAAAHAQGLIHRDIKPANILLENGVQRVKITDFGLARAAADASLTQSGVIAGTPQYMSPEQSLGEPQDHRTDLFSLGSVLYALCTGRPPFRADNTLAVLRRVAEDAPRPIRETNPEVPDWLEAIVAKLMEKHPADRFQSAAEVARLLEGHLAHLQQPRQVPQPLPVPPAKKRPGGGFWRPDHEFFPEGSLRWRLFPKKLNLLFWLAVVGAVLCLAICLVPVAILSLFLGSIDRAPAPPVAAPPVEVPGGDAAQNGVEPLRGVGLPVEPKATFNAGKRDLLCLAISPDEKTLAAGFEDGSVVVWDVATRKASTLVGHKLPVRSLAFTPQGKMLLSGAGELPKPKASGELKLWNLATGKEDTSYDVGDVGPVSAVAVSPDGRTIVAGGETGIKWWEVVTGTGSRPQTAVKGVRSVDFSPNGQELAVVDERSVVNLYDTQQWKLFTRNPPYKHRSESVSFNPEGKTLAMGYEDGTVKLWDSQIKDTALVALLATVRVSEQAAVRSLAHCCYGGKDAGGRWVLAVGLSDQTVKLIDATDPGKPIDLPQPGEQVGSELAVSPKGTCLATGHRNGVIRLWDLSSGKPAVPSGKDPAKKDVEQMQGTWDRAAIVHRGEHFLGNADDTVTYSGNQFTMKEYGAVTLAGTFEIVDAAASPKQMDLICTEGRHKGKRLRAIYRLDGDRLETCTDDGTDSRPKDFSGDTGFYRDMRRVKP
jgi:uncharacterized protein (TIGR03067 family)